MITIQFKFLLSMARNYPLLKVARQHKKTRTQLLKSVSDVPVKFQEIFAVDVVRFLNSKATCLNSSIGYLAPALLATTASLSPRNGYTVEILKNNYLIYIQSLLVILALESHQPCSTVALNHLIGQLLKDNDSTLFLNRETSSGLVKHLGTKNRSYF